MYCTRVDALLERMQRSQLPYLCNAHLLGVKVDDGAVLVRHEVTAGLRKRLARRRRQHPHELLHRPERLGLVELHLEPAGPIIGCPVVVVYHARQRKTRRGRVGEMLLKRPVIVDSPEVCD